MLKNEEVKLYNKKNIFENVISPSASELYERFSAAKNNKNLNTRDVLNAVHDGLVGNSITNQRIDNRELHNYLMASAKIWRQKVEEKSLEYVATHNFAEKQQVLEFCKALNLIDLDKPFDPTRPRMAMVTMDIMSDNLADIKKTTSLYSRLNLCAVPQEGFDYLHIKSNTKNINPISIRLYMNIKPNNRITLIDAIKQESEKQGIPFYGKFTTSGDPRRDNFLVYTNDLEAEKQIKIIGDIKQAKPHLFEGAEELAPIWGRLKGNEYIGVGEEPLYILENGNYTNTSYTAIREDIFKDYYERHGEKFDAKAFADVCKEYGVSAENFAFNLDTARYSSKEHFNDREKQIKGYISSAQQKGNEIV